jgi:hypothetical protein
MMFIQYFKMNRHTFRQACLQTRLLNHATTWRDLKVRPCNTSFAHPCAQEFANNLPCSMLILKYCINHLRDG